MFKLAVLDCKNIYMYINTAGFALFGRIPFHCRNGIRLEPHTFRAKIQNPLSKKKNSSFLLRSEK